MFKNLGLRILSFIVYFLLAFYLVQFGVHLLTIKYWYCIDNLEDDYIKGFKKIEFNEHNYSIEPIYNLDIRKVNDLIYS